MSKSNFGLFGLGVMGKSIALNCLAKGHSLSVYNRAEGKEQTVVADFLYVHNNKNLKGYTTVKEFVNSLSSPRKIIVMVNAGATVDVVIEALLPFLSSEDIIIDGGNSHYLDTKRRNVYLKEKQIDFIGAGISGEVAPILESMAARDSNGLPCCTYVGPEGAGHFVKMVHNGIEYAEMQLLAELVFVMNISMTYEEIASIFKLWQKEEDASYLLEITAHILEYKEGDTYLLDLILDKAGNKGTGSWSTIEALRLGVANTMMSEAVFARYVSALKTERLKLSEKIESKKDGTVEVPKIEVVQKGYRFARLINHHQGFELIKHASKTYDWDLKLSEIARVWTNGCIIKSSFMEDCVSKFQKHDSLLNQSWFTEQLSSLEGNINKVIQYGLSTRIPTPCFYSAYNYWVSMTTGKLSANIIQAQRDYFGAHTYERLDKPRGQYFHTKW